MKTNFFFIIYTKNIFTVQKFLQTYLKIRIHTSTKMAPNLAFDLRPEHDMQTIKKIYENAKKKFPKN